MISKIPLFYPRDNLDAFLAIHAAIRTKAFPPIAKHIPVSPGEVLPSLSGLYPLFFHVDFNSLGEIPDLSECVNVVMFSKYSYVSAYIDDPLKLPSKPLPPKVKSLSRFHLMLDEEKSVASMAWDYYYKNGRRKELEPEFVKYVIDAVEDPSEDTEAKQVIAGIEMDQSFLQGDLDAFEQRFILPFPEKKQDIVKAMFDAGSKKVDNELELIKALLVRNTITTNFAGHQVKLAQVPEEFAHRAGNILAKNEPFAVIIEDRYTENSRIYHLYSDVNGLDVLEVGKPFQAVGAARYATFFARVDFTNHKFI